jgi:isocitrate dehydrogenase kinase/phosphatase
MGALSEAEAQAQRDRVVSELTEYAKERLVQGLYSQRKDLAETQQKAQHALAELEARLTALHLPMQQRIAAYEERIAQLHKELETRDGEMRELIQATVLLVRERLEETKERDASRFFDS